MVKKFSAISFILSILSLLTVLIASAVYAPDKPEIISRTQWGAEPATGDMEEHTITHVTIHHGGVVFPEDKDPVAYMKNLQTFSQQDKNWIDIPYHFCIDLNGKIYEARSLKYPGDTNTEYDPTGHALINVMGNYEEQEPSEAQLEAIAHLSAWLAHTYEVGEDHIASHKDHSDQTVCPGKNLYLYFENGELKERIRKHLEQ